MKKGQPPHKGKTSPSEVNSNRVGRVVPKYIICLRILLKQSLVELEALREYGETCLHSTISTLYNQKGIRFHRKPEAHRHKGGGVVYFTRYSLYKSDRKKAMALIAPYVAANDE